MGVLEDAIAEKERRDLVALAVAEKERRAATDIDFTQLPLVDLSQEEPVLQILPEPVAGADPTSIGPTPGAEAESPIGENATRAVKQFINQTIINPIKNISKRSSIGIMNQQAELLAAKQAFRAEHGTAMPRDQDLALQKEIHARAGEDVPSFDIPEGTIGQRLLIDTPVGIASFVTKLFLMKRAMGAGGTELGTLEAMAVWETLNQVEGDVSGKGAALRGALSAIGQVPTVSAAGKVTKIAVGGGLFGGLTAAEGGTMEDIIVSTMIGAGYQAWGIAKQTQFLKDFKQNQIIAAKVNIQGKKNTGLAANAERHRRDLAVAKTPEQRAKADSDLQKRNLSITRNANTEIERASARVDKDMEGVIRRIQKGEKPAPKGEQEFAKARARAQKQLQNKDPRVRAAGQRVLNFLEEKAAGAGKETLEGIPEPTIVEKVVKAAKKPVEGIRRARIRAQLERQKGPPVAKAPAAKAAPVTRPAPVVQPEGVEEAKGQEGVEPPTPSPVAAKAVDNTALLRERTEIKATPPKQRTPQQIERLDEVETTLVEENADEFPDIDITPKTRNIEVKKVNDQIKSHGIYQAELAAIEDVPEVPTQVMVDSTEIGDVRARFEGRPEMLRRFKQQETGGARWDEAAAEIGIESLDDYMDAVELSVESKKPLTGGINEVALSNALNSGDPSIVLFATKRQMLKEGFNAAEINKEIQNVATEFQISQEFITPELISLEELSDVAKKQRILKELDRQVKKVTKTKDFQSRAIQKAKGRAAREKRVVFVVERQGRPIVTIKEPRSGTFTKITPAAPGETEGLTETITLEPKPKGKPKPEPQTKEQKLLIQRINLEVKKKGLTQTLFSDLKLKHGGSRRLTGRTPRTVEQLQAVFKAVQRARPKVIGHKKVLSLKTEKQITELKESLTNLGFMNDAEFAKILQIEARGKQAKFVDARNFITQKQSNEILLRMHDTAQRLRVTEPIDRAIAGNPTIAAAIEKIAKQPQRRKDPGRLRSMRFFFQRLGVQANERIYDVFLDLTLAADAKSRERHDAMKLAEKLPDFTKIATDTKALKRVEDWIVSQSNLENKPAVPTDITENELRLAKLVQASFKSYETLARAGKFFEFFDKRTELPQYLKFKQGIDKAFDVYNTKGYDALIRYLDTQDWGIVRAGYSPMESVVRKVSTNRMPDIAVGKGRIKTRGIQYQKQDRDILQRWYSYMRQMDQLIHIQPRIKSLVRLINDNQTSFIKPGKINSAVSTYLDNLKHTNYEDGLIEEFSRKLYSQAITVRVLADPVKPLRNLLQNVAFSEDRRDILDPRNKKLSAEDVRYLETFVQQSSVMMSDWAFTGEQPFDFFWIRRGIKKLTDKDLPTVTKWVQRKTLYPQSDRLNRTISFTAKINRVRRAFGKNKPLAKQMRDARFSDMQKEEQRVALGILAKDGIDDMARYIAKVHTDNTHFLYAREQRSPAEQTKGGRIFLNLQLFKRAALEKAVLQMEKTVEKGTGTRAKLRAANVLMTLVTMSALVGLFFRKMTGQKYSPYSYLAFLELNFGGLMLATLKIIADAYNSMLAILTSDPKKLGKAIDEFGVDITRVGDYLIPFYDLGLRGIEAIIGSENIDRQPFRQLREIIDAEYKSRGLAEIDRDLIEKMQFTFAKGGKQEPTTEQESTRRKFSK